MYKWLVRGREAEVVPPSYSAATASPHLPPSYSQCVVQQQETSPPRYSLVSRVKYIQSKSYLLRFSLKITF